MSHIVDIYLTVDTEISSPLGPRWRARALDLEIRRDIDGCTRAGDVGLQYQMDLLNAHGLRATFFVEALFASAVGIEPLRRIVHRILEGGHDVQLHLHPEWLGRMPQPPVPSAARRSMKDFTAGQQRELLRIGLDNLRQAGADHVCAFRAGNYGANVDTLDALREHGIAYDSSYNYPYRNTECPLGLVGTLTQPTPIAGLVEFPIACFEDWPGHHRPAQFVACSSAELEAALLGTWARRGQSFVLVSHSFEFVRRNGRLDGRASPSRIVMRRFERFCRFVAAHPDRFRTRTFGDLGSAGVAGAPLDAPLRSNVLRTAWRYVEQIASRVA